MGVKGNNSFDYVVDCYKKLSTQSTRWKTFIPTIAWYGLNNQYHVWLVGNGKILSSHFREEN